MEQKTLDVLQGTLNLLFETRDWVYIVPHSNTRGFSTDKTYFFDCARFKMYRTVDEVGVAIENDFGQMEHFSYKEFLEFFERH